MQMRKVEAGRYVKWKVLDSSRGLGIVCLRLVGAL